MYTYSAGFNKKGVIQDFMTQDTAKGKHDLPKR